MVCALNRVGCNLFTKRQKNTTMTQLRINRRPIDAGFNNLLNDFFNTWPVYDRKEGQTKWTGSVPVNIRETENAYQLELVAPGFDRNDFKVSVENNQLTIEGKKEQKSDEQKNEKWIRNEYRFQSFKRSFTLDEQIESTGIEAKYENGVLVLNLPRKVEVKTSAKEISVQ
jgi:HSP20 family protein